MDGWSGWSAGKRKREWRGRKGLPVKGQDRDGQQQISG